LSLNLTEYHTVQLFNTMKVNEPNFDLLLIRFTWFPLGDRDSENNIINSFMTNVV